MDQQTRAELLEKVNELKKQGYSSICFWMPCYNVGGGSRYLCDMAMFLSENTDLKIYFVDFKNGYPTQLLQTASNITIIDYDPSDIEFCLQEPIIVLTNSTRVIQIKRMNPKSKILFWHYETIPCGWHILFFNGEEKKFIKRKKIIKSQP